MKKLRLRLAGKEMLSKEQMKKVTGGYGSTYCPENYTPTIKCVFPNGAFAGWMYTYANAGCTYTSYWDYLCDSWYTGANEMCTGNPGVGTASSDRVTCYCSQNPSGCI